MVLAGFNNVPDSYGRRFWWLSGSTSVASGSQLTIGTTENSGVGAGTSSGDSIVYGGGAIKIGHGLTGPTDPPKISLIDSEQGYDTLYIRKADGTTPAHLDLGDLTVHGDLHVEGEISSVVSGIFVNGPLTLADTNSISPASDGHSTIGETTKMWDKVYTRNILMGKNIGTPAHYTTFSIDDSGLNLTMTTSSSTGSLLPAAGKQLALGSSSQKWQNIYCTNLAANNITGLTNPITINTAVAPQLTLNATNAKIQLYSDCNLYRNVAESTTVLQTDNNFVCNGLNCNGISVNGNAGIVGALNIQSSLKINGNAGSSGQVLTSQGSGAPVWANSAWNGGTVTNDVTIQKSNAQLKLDATAGKIQFSSDTNLFRDSANVLKTDDSLTVSQNLWCNSLAVNTNAGIGTYIGFTASQDQIHFSPSGQNTVFWCYKPSESKYFGVYDSTLSKWIFYVDSTGSVPLLSGGSIYPLQSNNGFCGFNNYYWSAVYANYLLYHTSHGSFDALDDLSLVRNYKTKTEQRTIKGQTVEVEVIDDESLTFLRTEEGFYESATSIGFLLGCVKALVLRLEKLEQEKN